MTKVRRRRTNNNLGQIHFFVTRCVVFCSRQHIHYSGTSALLTKLHLQDCPVNGLPGNLLSKHIKFPMRDLEIGRRIFMLEYS